MEKMCTAQDYREFSCRLFAQKLINRGSSMPGCIQSYIDPLKNSKPLLVTILHLQGHHPVVAYMSWTWGKKR